MNELMKRWKSAIEKNETESVRRLFVEFPELKNHINDQIFSFDRSAIHCCRENLELVELLLEHGADLNLKTGWWAGGFGILEGLDYEQAKPLIKRGAIVDIWAAVSLNLHSAVTKLLDQAPELIVAPGGDGKHPLHDARDAAMVDLLVSRGADVNALCVDHESSPIQYSVQNREVVDRLLDSGAQADIFTAAYWGSQIYFDQAIQGNSTCCDSRLGTGKWKTFGNIYHWTVGHDATPQQVARKRGHADFLKVLLENASARHQLMDAIWCGDRERVESLASESAGLPQDLTLDDQQTLARAAWWYRPEAVKLMLELGFDPHVPGVHDSTPLDRASFHGYADIVQLLLEHDPCPPIEKKNEFGGTPLEACLYGVNNGWETGFPRDHPKTVQLLVEAGSPVNQQHLGRSMDSIDQILRKCLKQ